MTLLTLEHAGQLDDLEHTPRYLMPRHEAGQPQIGRISCSFCGVGDSGVVERTPDEAGNAAPAGPLPEGEGLWQITLPDGKTGFVRVEVGPDSTVRVPTAGPLTPPGGVLSGLLQAGQTRLQLMAHEVERERGEDGLLRAQLFRPYVPGATSFKEAIRHTTPTGGCVKLKLSTMRQRPAYPIHAAPSQRVAGQSERQALGYQQAISRLTDLVLEHRGPGKRTLVYASGQIDYFTIFAMQEVFRLLGVRNLTGNAEHCLNAGASHNEVLTGQEGPFLTVEQAVKGPQRFYLLNGWNGFITHPPVWKALSQREDLDAYLIEVAVTETAKALARQLGKDRVILIRPRSDPHLALAVAHEILIHYPDAPHWLFLSRFANQESFELYKALARSEQFQPVRVAERIAPEPEYVDRILHAIRDIALKMVQPSLVPINIPSVGLSQTSGIVAHCTWANVMAMVGKYGLYPDGQPAGGTLRVPGQINAESEVQGLSRKYFMGRIPMAQAPEAARRMGLPDDAYEMAVKDTARAALDYSDPTPGEQELFICMGTQFEANMMGRPRWIEKLRAPGTTLVVIDPIPDPFTLEQAELIIPSPPHPATTKLYQNGEWKMMLSVPQKRAAPETRSDATILYDLMAEVARRLETQPEVAAAHPDLARHVQSGYLQKRFRDLSRFDGEVSRAELWDRIMDYMSGGKGPLYCRPDHADGRPITWEELLERGHAYYGGVGVNRFKLDYDDEKAFPYRNIYREPGQYRFFVPTPADLSIPEGILLNSGRGTLSDDRDRVSFATATFNSGKATPIVNMPDDQPLNVSPILAQKQGLRTGDRARVTHRETGAAIELPVVVTDRCKGDSVYVSFHRSRAQMERGVYVNDVTGHLARCPYSGQTQAKIAPVLVERVTARVTPGVDVTAIDPTRGEIPVWNGQNTALYVTDILQETHDVFTFRFQGDPLCRFQYLPGQFCSLVLRIDGKRVIRSYSISSTPTRPYTLEITVKRVPGGLVSNWLPDNLRIGSRVEVAGPKGKFSLVPGKIPPKILFLAAGSGVTPLMAMTRWLCDVSAPVDVRFFNAVRSPDDIIFEKELEMLTSRHKQFEPINVAATRSSPRGWSGMTGRISRKLLELVAPDLHERHVYLCGPEGFFEASKALLTEMQFDLANFHYESFGGVRTSTEAKGGEAAAPAGSFQIEFARAGKIATTDGTRSLLDIAEENDVELDYGCRSGSCGDCKIKLLSGEVKMTADDALSAADRAAGMVLSCTARPTSSCSVEG